MTDIRINNQTHTVQVHRRVFEPKTAPRLFVVAFQPNELASKVLHVCIETIKHYTPEPYELWVIDNNSPREYVTSLLERSDINVVLNQMELVAVDRRGFVDWLMRRQFRKGSYANALGLELGVRLIESTSEYIVTLHMDTMPCRAGWLSFLGQKLGDGIAAAGVRMDSSRTPGGDLHILGCLVDFQLFQKLELGFWPALPRFDVGDRVTVALREAGHEVFSCGNTFCEPELLKQIPATSPFRRLHVDRSFDDDGNVIFLHLGRGIRKSTHDHAKGPTAEEWISFAHQHLLV